MKPLIKRHVIKVAGTRSGDSLDRAVDDLVRILGVNAINLNRESGTVDVTYDLAHISYRTLERKLGELGCLTVHSPLQRLKRLFINFTEQNQIVSRHLETVNTGRGRGTR